MRTCSITNCFKKHEAKGYCGAHYRRFRLFGDPLGKKSNYNELPPPGLARCRNCGLLPESEFYVDQNRRGKGRSSECKKCFRKRAATLPVKKKDHRKANLKKFFGITVEQYDQMFDDQNGLCAICKQPETDIHHATGAVQRLAVDHDKNSGRIRGLLCAKCNKGIGSLRHNLVILSSAIEYLRRT